MKRLILLILAAIPLFAFTVNFVYCDYDDDNWCDEYWGPEPDWCDEYWVWYPHGYYCVYYVWYHPWWWDWYWWHCYWCHHFDWHFFRAGFYVVWFEDGCWWWRPRYGRWVRYKLPYEYAEFRVKARAYGVNLPDKPPREINLPYNEKEVLRLTKEKDPQLYARIEKEYKSGNLEKMRKEYEIKVKREIEEKNQEYKRMKVNHPAEERYEKGNPERFVKKNITRKEDFDYTGHNTKLIKKAGDNSFYDEEEKKIDKSKSFIDRDDEMDKNEYKSRTPVRNLPPRNPDAIDTPVKRVEGKKVRR
jgi:hypothetical protein|uniref:Uncharacterized protein n=1 Tax=candidate division WOR-3 bacterium TaxID=2052148 RepID=A0A7V3RIS5_UNCW3